MKNIKYTFLSLILTISAILSIDSCSDDINSLSINPTNNSENLNMQKEQYDYLNLATEYQQIGKFHNEGLDTVFIEIYKSLRFVSNNLNKTERIFQIEDINSIVKDATLKYSYSSQVIKTDKEKDKQVINDFLNTKLNNSENQLKSNQLILNSVQKELMDSVYSAIKSECQESADLSNLKTKLENINQRAKEELSGNDVICIYSATSMAYSSFQYWQRNINKWAYLMISHNMGNDRCDELGSEYANLLVKGRIGRLKSDYFELIDGSYLLPEVIITYHKTDVWKDTIEPIVLQDCSSAGQAAIQLAGEQYLLGDVTEAAYFSTIAASALVGSSWAGIAALFN